MKSLLILVPWLSSGNILAQAGQQPVGAEDSAGLDAQRKKHALQFLVRGTEKEIASAAHGISADKYGIAPTDR
jgi:hypothetical protein